MAKDRPWNRQPDPHPDPQPTNGPDNQYLREPTPELHSPGIAGLKLHDMTDAEVRTYCLGWARHHLLRYDMELRRTDEHLVRAAHLAQIAQAFRPEPASRLTAEQEQKAVTDASATVLVKLQKRWAHLLGPVGEHTTPVGYDSHTQVLDVECQPNGWSFQMKILADEVIPILNSELGFDAIQSLSITPDPDD